MLSDARADKEKQDRQCYAVGPGPVVLSNLFFFFFILYSLPPILITSVIITIFF